MPLQVEVSAYLSLLTARRWCCVFSRYDFWSHPFTRCAPEIQHLFETVARSCLAGGNPAGGTDGAASTGTDSATDGGVAAVEGGVSSLSLS